MKKPLFIGIIVAIGLLITGGLVCGGYNLYNYTKTLDNFEALNQTKLITVNNADSFINPNDLATDVELEEEAYSEYAYVYKRDNIYFLSNSGAWDRANLELLANELYKNKHGEEMKYLSSVILNEGTEDRILGTQESIKTTFEIPLSLYNFLPVDNFNAKTVLSEINLYEADINVTVEDMAIVLSHEYGHHFTNYHFNLTFSQRDKQTEYYKIRSQSNDDILLSSGSYNSYVDNHMRYLVEFAAEDYVYFMGSENAHRVVEFYDTYEQVAAYARFGEDELNKIDTAFELCRNGIPHENVSAGLPCDVEGLEEYFYSFIDEEMPERKEREDIGTLNLSMIKTGSKEHKFTWDQPYTAKNIIYTLILYDEYDNVFCMAKTTTGDEKGMAQFGYYKYRITKGNWIHTYSFGWDIDLGTNMRARVSITFPDGTIMLSDAIDFVY